MMYIDKKAREKLHQDVDAFINAKTNLLFHEHCSKG